MSTMLFFGTTLLSGVLLLVVLTHAEGAPEDRGVAVETKGGRGHVDVRRNQGGGGSGKMPEFAPLQVTVEQAKAQVTDHRIHVPMPPEQKAILREQMKQFLVIQMQVQGLLAEGKLHEAADLVESTMGRTERGSHKGTKGGGPGLYMPVAMRSLAWNMHETASQFAETARKGNVKESYKALQTLQSSCVSCHLSYTTR